LSNSVSKDKRRIAIWITICFLIWFLVVFFSALIADSDDTWDDLNFTAGLFFLGYLFT